MPESGSRTATVPVVWANLEFFSARSKWFPVAIGDHGRNLVVSLWPETKQQSMEWRHSGSPPPKKILSAKIRWKCSRLDFLGSRRHPPHWFSSKGPNYQRGVSFISAGAIEGHFEGKTPQSGKIAKGVLFLHDSAPAHWALATQKKLAYLGFQCLDYSPYSPDLAPSDCQLFTGLKTIER